MKKKTKKKMGETPEKLVALEKPAFTAVK